MDFSSYENLEIELPLNPVDSGEFDIDNDNIELSDNQS